MDMNMPKLTKMEKFIWPLCQETLYSVGAIQSYVGARDVFFPLIVPRFAAHGGVAVIVFAGPFYEFYVVLVHITALANTGSKSLKFSFFYSFDPLFRWGDQSYN